MARASRFSKKQPAFDPSELNDLIVSPAVGTGVGSLLLGVTEECPALTENSVVESDDMTTVAMSGSTTVDEFSAEQSIVLSSGPNILNHLSEVVTSVQTDMPTVDIINMPAVVELTTVTNGNYESEQITTVASAHLS